jgi:DNA phosphorothioation-dependent restriction protein DptH
MQENARLLNMAVSSTPVSEWAHRLSLLQKGECWVLGPTLNEQNNKLSNQAKKVKITSLEERGFHG